MPDINQNFSLSQGSDLVVEYDIGPDNTGLNLTFATVTATFWTLTLGVPDTDKSPVITKNVSNGITITDPLLLKLTIALVGADTVNLLPGNYFYKIKIAGNDGKIKYPTYGIMTVLRSD